MPVFTLLCRDKDNSVPLRMETRPAHLDYLGGAGDKVLLGGPMLNDAGEPVGSLVIIEADSAEAAKTFADNDPYARAGLFKDVEITPYRIGLGVLAPKS